MSSVRVLASLLPCVLGLVVCLSGCATPKEAPVTYHRSEVAYVMAPLDVARVTQKSGEVVETQITLDGTIDLNGTTRQVKGMEVADFRSLVSRSYPSARKVELIEFRPNRVTVLGEVFHQIHTDLGDGPMRVMDAIASANGFTPLANKRRVRLLRENAGVIEVYDLDLRVMMNGEGLDQNLLLQPGDTITVPRNFL